jgi:hypothetical protein
VVDRAALEKVFSEYFGLSCHSFIPLIAPQSSLSIFHGWYNKPVNGHKVSGFGSVRAKWLNKKKIK